jgi:hypothetical protein
MHPSEAFSEALRLSGLLDAGIAQLREASIAVAGAERDYRKSKAQAWVECPRDDHGGRATDWTAGKREAWVDAQTADLRYTRDLAEGVRAAATEAVRARRTQISMLQSLMNAHRAEAELAGTGPHRGP